MPLSWFDYKTLSHFREVVGKADQYGHTFGGEASSFGIRFVNSEPLHLIYRLNQDDPAVGTNLPELQWLPLVYHFSYASYESTLIYRVLNEREIEIIAPLEAEHDPDFPDSSFPRSFPKSPLCFRKQEYDSTVAEDALQLAAIFGLDHLSDAEMKRAVVIADETSETVSDWGLSDWTSEDIVRFAHREPFMQGAPVKECGNPGCTAEIAYRSEASSIPIDDEAIKELLGDFLTMEARDVRKDSMQVLAIHQPDEGDERVWADVQIIFEICECCHCIRVTNQCT